MTASSAVVVRGTERVRIRTPLGILFWDEALDAPVAGGLLVRAWLAVAPEFPVIATRTSSGAYAFHGLPGLHDVEYPAKQRLEPADLPPPLEYVVDVVDGAGRFLPARFGVKLPLPYEGLLLNGVGTPGSLPGGSMPGPDARVYLFSAPHRPVPANMAAMRAQLRDETASPDSAGNQPGAAYAVLSVTVGGRTRYAIADHRGSLLLLFSYPKIEGRPRVGSPPSAWEGSTAAPTWPAVVRAFYGRLVQPRSGGSDAVEPPPTLRQILRGQPPALVRPREGSPPLPEIEWPERLAYGEALVLRTARSDPTQPASDLWITPGTSLP